MMEPNAKDMAELGNMAVNFITEHIGSLDNQPSNNVSDAKEFIENQLPYGQTDARELFEIIKKASLCSVNTAGPGFMAYIPGGGLFESAVADMIACGVNRYTAIYGMSPALATLEINVINWLCSIMGYGEGAFGTLTPGGSMANFSALITAREKFFQNNNFRNGRIYASNQTHHSMKKAVKLAGFPYESLVKIKTNEHLQLDVRDLETKIQLDKEQGFEPFMISANAGSTNTGTVDDLIAMKKIAEKYNLWFHVDAAYGGFFNLTERGKAALKGIEQADSMTLDPHKGMFLPYGTGAVIVKSGKDLYMAHHENAEYLRDLEMDGKYNFADFSAEMTRDFRGLRLWMPLKLYGLDRFESLLNEKLDLAQYAFETLKKYCQIIHPPQLSLFAFRFLSGSGNHNDLNNQILQAVNGEKHVYLSSTTIDGDVYLRICILSFRTHKKQVDQALESLLRHYHAIEN